MYKVAYANSPYRTPDSIRGPSLKELHVQRKANDEMEDLLSSDSSSAGTKAFARGVAAGTALPLILGGVVPWAVTAQKMNDKVVAQTHLAALLKREGVAPAAASDQAATVYHYLQRQKAKPSEKLLDAVRPSMKTYATTQPLPKGVGNINLWKKTGIFPTRSAAEAYIRQNGGTAEVIDRGIREAILELPAPKALRTGPGPIQVAAVLEEAARAFKEGGESMTSTLTRAHAKHFGKMVGKALPATALIALPSGLAGYAAHRRKRKKLQELRAEQARRRNGHG